MLWGPSQYNYLPLFWNAFTPASIEHVIPKQDGVSSLAQCVWTYVDTTMAL